MRRRDAVRVSLSGLSLLSVLMTREIGGLCLLSFFFNYGRKISVFPSYFDELESLFMGMSDALIGYSIVYDISVLADYFPDSVGYSAAVLEGDVGGAIAATSS